MIDEERHLVQDRIFGNDIYSFEIVQKSMFLSQIELNKFLYWLHSLMRLNHPNVQRYYQTFEDEENWIIIKEFVKYEMHNKIHDMTEVEMAQIIK